MKLSKLLTLILLLSYSLTPFRVISQDTIKVMWYNILNYPEINSTRTTQLRTILQYEKPDIFVVCEITGPAGASSILNSALNVGTVNYAMANYIDGPDDENMLFYNSTKLGFVEQNEINAYPRQFNEYILYYKDPSLSISSDTAYLYLYASHLKAGNTDADKMDRTAAAVSLRDYLFSRSFSENTILGGDMNIYGSSEDAYKIFTGESQANLFDPIGSGEYHSNSLFSMNHTQSTRLVSIDGGATGGMDDRFDMMFFSDDIRFGTNGIQFLDGSYKVVGQDGQHFNQAVNSPANNSVPASVLNALYNMSDHLPITLKLVVGGQLAVEEWSAANKWVHIFPNPGKDNILISSEEGIPFEVELFDMLGRNIYESYGFGEHLIDARYLIEGCYILRVNSSKGSICRKVLLE